MLSVDAIAVVFDDFPNQQMFVCIDEASHVFVLSSEAADLANRKEFGDVDEELIRKRDEEVFVGTLSILGSDVMMHLF